MARKKTHTPLNVFMNGRLVGTLNKQASGAIDFTYADDWLGWEFAIPVSRSLPLRGDRYLGAPVVAVFENLLPDNQEIRQRVAERTGAKGIDAYSLLASIGRDCVGALQFLPDGEAPIGPQKPTGTLLTEADIAGILRGLTHTPLGLKENDDFRISIAGAQEKTALLRMDGQWLKPKGISPTTHIFKPPIGMLPNGIDLSESVENEFLCMTLMKELGLLTAKVSMDRFEDQKALVVERFDRRKTKEGKLLRLPQEDMCQALSVPPTLKYESEGGPGLKAILKILRESDTPYDDQCDFLKTQILFWLLGATDGHAKNFSLFLFPGGRFRMTPLYDIISVLPAYAAHQLNRKEMKLAMAVGDSRHYRPHKIHPRHFEQSAKAAGLGTMVVENIMDELKDDIAGAIARTEQRLPKGFPMSLTEPIFDALIKAQEKY